jgi:hypothetical protein
MPTRLQEALNTLQHYSFTLCDENSQIARRVKICDPIDSRPSGLNIGGLVTVVALSAGSWTALPPTALTDRNAIAIQNQSEIEVKINYDDTESGYVGIIIPPGGERFYDVGDNIDIFAKAASGTPDIVVEEIS